jgi:hypothetical protein
MTTAVSSTAARTSDLSAGDAFMAATGAAMRKATASAAKGVIDAVATTAADQLGRAITGSATKSRKTTKKTTTAKKSTTSKGYSAKPGEFDFLKDKSLSVEERLFRFMQVMSKKYDSQLEKKMNEIAAKQHKKAEAPKKKSGPLGGILKSVGSIMKSTVPLMDVAGKLLGDKTFASLLKQVSGPVLAAGATALGMPQLVPLVLKFGPEIAAAIPEAAREFGLTDEPGAAKTSSSSSKSGDPEMSNSDQMELQRIMEKQKEMFTTISAVLKSMHDTKMSIIGNIR